MIEGVQFERWIGRKLRYAKRGKWTNLKEFERCMDELERELWAAHREKFLKIRNWWNDDYQTIRPGRIDHLAEAVAENSWRFGHK